MIKKLAGLFVFVALLVSVAVVYADQPEILKIDVCHATGSENNPYVLVNVSIHSVEDANGLNGHGDHEDDAWEPFTYDGVDYPGQGDMSWCDGAPTEVPTDEPTPTSTEESTATPTEEPTDEPTPTSPGPTPTDIGPTPTDTPPSDDPDSDVQLPSAGFISQTEIMNGEPWIVMLNEDTTVWAAHNQEGWPAAEWWQLWEGVEFEFNGQWYTVTDYIFAQPTDVHLIYSTEPDIILITCRGYSAETNSWSQRLVIYAELSDV